MKAPLAIALCLVACREPTEITLEVTTDAPCSEVVTTFFYVGRPGGDAGAPAAEAPKRCVNGRIGSLVVVPSGGEDEAIEARVVTGLAGSQCDVDPTKGCIEARRSLRYIPHTPLVLPIVMSKSCVDVRCPVAQTCVAGACVSDVVDVDRCVNGRCDLTSPPPGDAGPIQCAAPLADAGAPLAVFHFDEGAGTKTSEATNPLLFGNVLPSMTWMPQDALGCGSALQIGPEPLTLPSDPVLMASQFTVEAWVRLPLGRPAKVLGLVAKQNAAGTAGWRLSLDWTGAVTFQICNGGCGSAGMGLVADAAWHRVAGFRGATTLGVCLDDVCVSSSGSFSLQTAPDPLVVGTGFDATTPLVIDELRFYPRSL